MPEIFTNLADFRSCFDFSNVGNEGAGQVCWGEAERQEGRGGKDGLFHVGWD